MSIYNFGAFPEFARKLSFNTDFSSLVSLSMAGKCFFFKFLATIKSGGLFCSIGIKLELKKAN